METMEFAAGFVLVMIILIGIYNSMGSEKPVKKDYGNEEISKAFARGCVHCLFGEKKK